MLNNNRKYLLLLVHLLLPIILHQTELVAGEDQVVEDNLEASHLATGLMIHFPSSTRMHRHFNKHMDRYHNHKSMQTVASSNISSIGHMRNYSPFETIAFSALHCSSPGWTSLHQTPQITLDTFENSRPMPSQQDFLHLRTSQLCPLYSGVKDSTPIIYNWFPINSTSTKLGLKKKCNNSWHSTIYLDIGTFGDNVSTRAAS